MSRDSRAHERHPRSHSDFFFTAAERTELEGLGALIEDGAPAAKVRRIVLFAAEGTVPDRRAISKVTCVTYLQIGPAYSCRHELRTVFIESHTAE